MEISSGAGAGDHAGTDCIWLDAAVLAVDGWRQDGAAHLEIPWRADCGKVLLMVDRGASLCGLEGRRCVFRTGVAHGFGSWLCFGHREPMRIERTLPFCRCHGCAFVFSAHDMVAVVREFGPMHDVALGDSVFASVSFFTHYDADFGAV